MNFLSTFAVGGTTQAFSAKIQQHGEDVKDDVTIHVAAVFQNESAWGAMATLRTWKYSKRIVPGAATIADAVVIQVLGGPGFGTLSIDAYKTWSALLSDMQLTSINKAGLVFGRLTFLMEPA